MPNMLADRYMIVRSLGEGGMADVYLAMDTILNREVAIKILRGELSSDPVTLLRFTREANAASKLNHPNVVQVYDVGEVDNRHYIVMEYVRGRTLKQLIQIRGALHKEEAVGIMKQLVSAIAHAHSKDIIHRDIKPQNILVKDDGTVKIADFGIALAHNAVQLTQNDSVLGSAHYLAPETTRGEPATNQTDIYSLGIVFYELLTGSVPFTGDNPVSIAMKHLSEEVPSVREFNPSLPQSIENIIIKATAKNRANRYKSAEEMLEDLNHCLDEENANADKVVFEPEEKEEEKTVVLSNVSEAPEKIADEPHRSGWVVGALLVVVFAALIALLVYFSGILNVMVPTELTVPNVTNLTEERAREELQAMGFTGEITLRYENHDTIEAGEVIRTNPANQQVVSPSTPITLVISKGPKMVIENYVGQNIDEVEAKLNELGITVSKTGKPSKEKSGTILSQELLMPGDEIDTDSRNNRIRFTYATPAEFVMIDVMGQPIETAKQRLEELGAVVTLEVIPTNSLDPEELETIDTGVVIEQSVERGTFYIQEEGASIVLRYYE